jgi:hypothetical protein
MLRDEIENKIQLRKGLKKQTTIKKIMSKFDIKIKQKQMMIDEIEEKNKKKKTK